MQIGGISQKRSYKQQVIQLTQMLDNTIKQLSDTKDYSQNIKQYNQKLKHSLQQKDVRIRFLQSQIKAIEHQYDKIQKAMKHKEQEEMMSTQKNMKLSRLCNSQLEHELEYLKSENIGLVEINQQYLRELEEIRKWREMQVLEKSKWHQKVSFLKKDIQKKEGIIIQYEAQINKFKEESLLSSNKIEDYLGIQDSHKRTIKRSMRQQSQLIQQNNLNQQLQSLKEQNLNIRSQLSILRQRNSLIQQKYIQLQSQLQQRIILSKKQSITFNHLIQDINTLQRQISQKNIELSKTKEDVSIKTEQLKMMMEERQDLLSKVEDINLVIKRKMDEMDNLKVEHDIEVEELRQYHQQEIFSLKQKHEKQTEEKYESYNSVKEELMKVKKYLENEDHLESPSKITELEAQNLRMVEKIKSLEEQLVAEENLFHLSDRTPLTPLVMISETTLFDFEMSFKGKEKQQKQDKKRLQRLQQSQKLSEKPEEEEFELEKKIKAEINQERLIEQDKLIQELTQQAERSKQQIIDLQQRLYNKQTILLSKQQLIVRQKQQILQVSSINRELDELQKMSKQKMLEYEQTKRLNVQYVERIQNLNKDIAQINDKLEIVIEKVQQRFNIDKDQMKINDLIQYLSNYQNNNIIRECPIDISTQTQFQVHQMYAQTDEQLYKVESNTECIICEERMTHIEDLITINHDINEKLDHKNQLISQLQGKLKINQNLKIQNQEKYQMKVEVYQQKIRQLEEQINTREVQQQQEQHQSIQKQYVNDRIKQLEQLLMEQNNKVSVLVSQIKQKDDELSLQNQKMYILLENNDQLSSSVKQLQLNLQRSQQLYSNQLKSKQQYQIAKKQLQNKIQLLEQKIEKEKLQTQKIQVNQRNSQQQIVIVAQENKKLRQNIAELEANLNWAQSQIEKSQNVIKDMKNKQEESTLDKQNDSIKLNSHSENNSIIKQNQQLKIRVQQLQKQLQQSLLSAQKHKYSITVPQQQNVKSKQKKIIQKLKIQMSSFTRREQFLMEDRKQLKQQVFLTKRQLEMLKEDLEFERKRNANLEQLYERFRKNKQNQVRKYQSIATNSSLP